MCGTRPTAAAGALSAGTSSAREVDELLMREKCSSAAAGTALMLAKEACAPHPQCLLQNL